MLLYIATVGSEHAHSAGGEWDVSHQLAGRSERGYNRVLESNEWEILLKVEEDAGYVAPAFPEANRAMARYVLSRQTG